MKRAQEKLVLLAHDASAGHERGECAGQTLLLNAQQCRGLGEEIVLVRENMSIENGLLK